MPEPSPYAGGASCVSCHREQSRGHAQSRHARTFHHGRGLLDLPLPERPLADPDDPKVTHDFKRENDKIKVETHAGDKIYRLIVEYAFGTSDQYVTMIGRDEEQGVSSCAAFVVSHGGRGRLGTYLRRCAALELEREHPGRADQRARRGRALPVLPRHVLSRFSRSAARVHRPGGRRPRDRLRALPRPRRQPHEGDQRQFRRERHRERRDGRRTGDRQALCRLPHRRLSRRDQERARGPASSSARRGSR